GDPLMTIPVIRAVQWGTPGSPLLVLGPSLGTTAEGLWQAAASHLTHRFHVLAWDLPGHGRSPEPTEPFSMGELASAVVALADAAAADSGGAVGPFVYAGDSVGGAVGLHLLLEHPERVSAAALICTAATFGTPDAWQ